MPDFSINMTKYMAFLPCQGVSLAQAFEPDSLSRKVAVDVCLSFLRKTSSNSFNQNYHAVPAASAKLKKNAERSFLQQLRLVATRFREALERAVQLASIPVLHVEQGGVSCVAHSSGLWLGLVIKSMRTNFTCRELGSPHDAL